MPQPVQILNPADMIGRRWVIDVPVPKPHKQYLHVVSGPVWLTGSWGYWLAGAGEGGGPFIVESTLKHAMETGVEVPLGTDPLDYTCRECGVITHPAHYSNEQIAMTFRARGLCSTDAFWDDAHRDYMAGKRLVVNGTSYSIASERAGGSSSCRGHGGRRFRIQYPDGRVVESTNVWSQGPIPERWRDRMPDTATFIPDEPSPGMQFKHEGFLRAEVRR